MTTATIRTGDRVRLLSMPDDPDPIPAGSTGTVTRVTDGPLGQTDVRWDDFGRSLSLVPGVDKFEVIERASLCPKAVPLPKAVYEGLAAVRDSGMTNMTDRPRVSKIARRMGFDEAADWLNNRGNHTTYAQGLFRGFRAEGE